jgi:(E)-4-hydroxy-3-methylbut-2-enyl-diphosphate synthase
LLKTPSCKPSAVAEIKGPIVIANMSHYVTLNPEAYRDAGFSTDSESGTFVKGDGAADIIIASYLPEIVPQQATVAVPFKIWLYNDKRENVIPLFSPETYYETSNRSEKLNLILTGSHFSEKLMKYPDADNSILIFTYNAAKERFAPEKLFRVLETENRELNVVLNPVFNVDSTEELNIKAAATLGSYINDSRIAGISVTNRGEVPFRDVNRLCFSILQVTSARITRTIYLSCPTCGRTRFNLPDAVRRVKEKTGHLKGLKIAVMGCIVNGPGEMAGADWGYVGAARGKVHIYKGTEPVLKNIPEESAVDELLRLIAEDQAKR